MRNIILTILFTITMLQAYSQTWIDVGIKGGYGVNILINSNLINDENFKYILTPGYSFGAKLGLNFADYHQVTFDVMSTSFNQRFSYQLPDTINDPVNYDKTLNLNTVDFILLYRNNRNGSYFEIGPQYSKVLRAKGTNSNLSATDGNVADNIKSSYYSLVMGFGAFLVGTENTGLSFGFRFSYALSDIDNEQGKSFQYPAAIPYNTYNASHPFSALIVFELNHDLGYLSEQSCTKKKKILFF